MIDEFVFENNFVRPFKGEDGWCAEGGVAFPVTPLELHDISEFFEVFALEESDHIFGYAESLSRFDILIVTKENTDVFARFSCDGKELYELRQKEPFVCDITCDGEYVATAKIKDLSQIINPDIRLIELKGAFYTREGLCRHLRRLVGK